MVEILPPPAERRARLKELEAVIAAGWERVVEVGHALQEIRDDKLYKELGVGLTFEQYTRSRWSLAESTAYQYLDAYQISSAIAEVSDVPVLNESVARELAPLLRAGGPARVAEAWAKVSETYQGQRPPTAREVHHLLVDEGYREQVIGASSGKVNRRVRLGQFGDKLIAAEKRLNWFATKELGDKSLAVRDRQLAGRYADKCEALAKLLRTLAAGEALE